MSEFSKKRFFADGLLLCAVALAMRTVAMLFGAFVSRTVGAEGTGVYTVIMTVYSFAVTFATSGISLTVTRLVASAIGEGRGENIGRIMRGALIYATAFGLIATAERSYPSKYSPHPYFRYPSCPSSPAISSG